MLGTADEVRRKISLCLPETDWSDPNWGAYEGDGFTCEFNLGADDPVDGFMIHVRGGGDAVRPLLEMSARHGWYILDTVQNEWLHRCDNPEAGWPAFQSFRDQAIASHGQALGDAEPGRIASVLTSPPPRELSSAARWHIVWTNAVGPVLSVAAFWGLYFVERLFGINVLNYLRPVRAAMRDEKPEGFLLWAAVVVSIASAGYAAFYIRRALYLARHGVEVAAEVTSTGKVSVKGMVRVNYVYTVNGLRYTKAMSTTEDVADEYEDGTRPLILICDPRRPRRSMEALRRFQGRTYSRMMPSRGRR